MTGMNRQIVPPVPGSRRGWGKVSADLNREYSMTLNVHLQRIGICHFVAAGLLLVTSASVRAQTVVSTIQVGKDPVAVAVNSVTHQVFVANFGPNYPSSGPCVAEWGIVSVIDGATQSTHAVGLGLLQSPVAVALNSATDKAYVVSRAIT